MRNGWAATIAIPGKSVSMWAAITCSIGTKRSPSGRPRNRGSDGGTFTRAKRVMWVFGIADADGEVQRQVRDVREGVRRIDRQRRQDRVDAFLVGGAQVQARDLIEVLPADDPDARVREALAQRAGPHVMLAHHEVADALGDPVELFDGGQPVGRRRLQTGRDLFLEPGDPDLEELIEVVAEDREELHALEEREVGVLG